MELYALSVCPICDTEDMNRVWKQGEGSFVSLCTGCDSYCMVAIEDSWEVPIETLVEDFSISLVRLLFGLFGIFRKMFNSVKLKVHQTVSH